MINQVIHIHFPHFGKKQTLQIPNWKPLIPSWTQTAVKDIARGVSQGLSNPGVCGLARGRGSEKKDNVKPCDANDLAFLECSKGIFYNKGISAICFFQKLKNINIYLCYIEAKMELYAVIKYDDLNENIYFEVKSVI